MSEKKATITLNLSEAENVALEDLCKDLDQSKTSTLRQAIKLFIIVRRHGKDGEQLAFKRNDGTYRDLIIVGGCAGDD